MLPLLFISIASNGVLAVDHVKVKQQLKSPVKQAHALDVLNKALDVTTEQFGPYQLDLVTIEMVPARELEVTSAGEIVNIIISPGSVEWDKQAIPVKVPVRAGLLSYRLLLANKEQLNKFDSIGNLEQLKAQLIAGVLSGWKTEGIFRKHGINMAITHNFESVFSMLNKGRFDYIPRAAYEIYDELDSLKATHKNLIIEPNLALHIKTETYVYVSKQHPRLAKRFEAGLTQMLNSGELQKLADKHFAPLMEKANLSKRTIIHIDNPYFQ